MHACLHTAEVIASDCRKKKEEEEGGERGAAGPKDVSLPVCHKSSVLLCDRLADRASSVSSGTPDYCYTVTFFYFFFISEMRLLPSEAQRRKRGAPPVWCLGADTQLSHVRLPVSVWSSLRPAFKEREKKSHNQLSWHSGFRRRAAEEMAHWMDSRSSVSSEATHDFCAMSREIARP